MHTEARPPRKERERIRQRSEILDIALRLFVEKGYHHVSMREIADAAEFATGTLYKFFESKEALYRELVKTYAHRITDAIVSSLDSAGDEQEKIARFIHAHCRVLVENAPAIQLYFRQSQGFATDLADPDGEVSRVREAALRQLTTVIASGIRKGLFRDIDARQAAISLSAILQSLAFFGFRHDPPYSAREIAAFAEDLFFRGLLTTRRA